MAKPATKEKQVNAPESGAVAQTDQAAMVKASAANSLMTGAPDWLVAEMAGAAGPMGFEKVDLKADIILPRLTIIQSTSPEFKAKGSELELGDVIDNLSKVLYAKEGQPLKVIPIVYSKQRLMFESPMPPSPVICRSPDALKAQSKKGRTIEDKETDNCSVCVFKDWADEEKPKCTGFYNFLLLLPDFNYIAIACSFKSTGVKTARRWLSSMVQTRAHMFAHMFELTTKEQSNGSQTWHNFDFKAAGFVSQEEYLRGKGLYDTMKDKTWAPNEEDLDVEVNAESPSPTGEKPAPF